MANTIIEHKDFTFSDEKITEYSKMCEVLNKKKSFWGQFCSKDKAPKDKLIVRRQILVDPEAVASLNEGETPRKDSIKLVTYEIAANSYGSYIEYSRQALKNNRDSLPDMMGSQLAHARLFDIETVRSEAFTGTTNVVEKGTTWKATLKTANTRLFKNHAKKHNGYYDLICTPEHADLITEEAVNDPGYAGTKEGETIAKDGVVGYWQGFRIIRYDGEELYDETHANGIVLFLGLTEDGKFPVISRDADESNIEVISHDIGSAGASDPTNEHGTLASRIDNIAAALERPECLLKCTTTLTYVAADVPADYKPDLGTTGEVTSPAK